MISMRPSHVWKFSLLSRWGKRANLTIQVCKERDWLETCQRGSNGALMLCMDRTHFLPTALKESTIFKGVERDNRGPQER